MESSAILSDCRTYRYSLLRTWGVGPLAVFIMLNPSTADEVQNDPTIERCVRRAQQLGCGGLEVVNLFALRATDPRELYHVTDPIGKENDRHILQAAQNASIVVCGWGNHGSLGGRGESVLRMLVDAGVKPMALRVNKDGSPAHPLYIGYKVQPKEMSVR